MNAQDSTAIPSKTTSIKKTSGGRHRQYTDQQRKDRNRQAQAAFRARRHQHAKSQKDTIAELQHAIQLLQQSSLQANERASMAEKRCLLLENENQQLKTTMDYLLATQSSSSSSPSQCHSPLTSQSSVLSPPPTVDDFSLPPQQPLSHDHGSFLLDECYNDRSLEPKFNPFYVNFLDVPPANDHNAFCDSQQQSLINNEFCLG